MGMFGFGRLGLAAVLGLAALALPASAQVETRTIEGPTLDGLAIDRCLGLNRDCDWIAAHDLCARAGFTRATDWTWAYKGRTKTLVTREVCTAGPGMQCGGFLDITCARGPGVRPPEPVTSPSPTAPAPTVLTPDTPATPAPTILPVTPPAPLPETDSAAMAPELPLAQEDPVVLDAPALPDDPVVPDQPAALEAPDVPEMVLPTAPADPQDEPATAPDMADSTEPAPAPTPLNTGNIRAGIEDMPEGMIDGEVEITPDDGGIAPGNSVGSGVVFAEIVEGAHNCYETGPSAARLYIHCDLRYALTNTSTETIYWTSGRWQTSKSDGSEMDQRGIGYPTKTMLPGKTITLNTFCIIPTGEGIGTWAAWGAAQYSGSGDRNQFTWRLSAICP